MEFLFSVAPEVPAALIGDPLRLGQILINLSNNAVKFTHHGAIVVSVDLAARREASVILRFQVKDSGIGLTDAQQERLFQAFSQADESTARRFGGSGLGLAICKQLVEMMHGEIRVESEPGAGAAFAFTAELGMQTEVVDAGLQIPAELEKLRALVVDDSVEARQVLRDMLEGFGFDTFEAQSGSEAIAVLRQVATDSSARPFSLVLMDWKMPGIDGLEASQRIHADAEIHPPPTVIMVSAYEREEVMGEANAGQIADCLTKPVNRSTLLDVIVNALGVDARRRFTSRKTLPRQRTGSAELAGARVLVVEDNEVNRQIARELLEAVGIVVSTAADGREAVDRLCRPSGADEVDAVLMDVQMPEMDGYEATGLIREYPHCRELPIIAMTAHAMAEERQRCLDAGMNDHVSKPVEPDALMATLAHWISGITRPAPPVPGAACTRDEAPEQLPDTLPGLDIASGVARVRGNTALYRKLLQVFVRSSRDAASEIRESLQEDDVRQAMFIAHTVKGAAGNVCAKDLQQAAGLLEAALRADDTGSVPDLLQRFESALGQVIESVGRLA